MTLRPWMIGIRRFETACCPHITEDWNPRQHLCSILRTCLALMFVSWLLHYDTVICESWFQFLGSPYQTVQFGCSPFWNNSEYPPFVLYCANLPGLTLQPFWITKFFVAMPHFVTSTPKKEIKCYFVSVFVPLFNSFEMQTKFAVEHKTLTYLHQFTTFFGSFKPSSGAIITKCLKNSVINVPDDAVISGSLSPRHGASSGCGWRNGLQYEG